MSSIVSKRNTYSKTVSAKPYCGTCHKAGKPIEEYTNHWTRASKEANAVVTCPLILATVCTYCSKTGHWKKFCPTLSSHKHPKNVLAVHSVDAVDEFKVVMKKKSKHVSDVTSKGTSVNHVVEEKSDKDVIALDDPTEFPAPSVSSWASIVKKEPVARAVEVKSKPIEIMPSLETARKIDWKTMMKESQPIEIVVVPSLETAHKIDWKTMMKNTIDKEAEELSKSAAVVVKKELPYLAFPPILKNRTHFKKYANWADCESSDDEEDEDLEEEYAEDFQEELVYA
jgi:hypothetical protein